MTHEELDVMWSIATRKSIEENQPYTRYEFAKMVADKEREKCLKACDNTFYSFVAADNIRARGES